MRILLIMAMEAEAKPVISNLRLKPSEKKIDNYPCHLYKGELNKHELLLVVNGTYPTEPKVSLIGTDAGSLSCFLGINLFKPDLVINLGTAGGKLKSGMKIGDTILANTVYFHDRRVGIPGYSERALGSFQSWDRSAELAEKIGSKYHHISTGNSFELNKLDEEKINFLQSEAKEMEAAAIAWSASLLGVPFLALKSITDFIDVDEHSSEEQFFKNLSKACENLSIKIKDLIEAI